MISEPEIDILTDKKTYIFMKWVVDKYKKDLSPTFTKYGTLPKNMVLLWDFMAPI